VPDIGDFEDVPVIEVMVKAGDHVKPEDSLVSLESDKATMDVPAPVGGVVKEVKLKVGDKVSEGALIMLLDTTGTGATATAAAPKTSVAAPPAPTSAPAGIAEVRVPDIGDFKDVPVIEVQVKPGDTVKAEDSLITLESDKATMDVPAPLSGKVQEMRIKVGDKVSEGTLIMTLVTDSAGRRSLRSPPLRQQSPLQLPLRDPLVPVVNIEGVKAGELTFDADTLAQIFLGKITKWDDPAIKMLNLFALTGNNCGAPFGRVGNNLQLHGLSLEGESGLEERFGDRG
jgi:pyruvate/2-oxoglutarate dehydrogenase complex dihydrolipoamide acyltransferase (E2) component